MFKEINERELGLGDILTKGWSVYCQQIKAIAMIVLLVHVPINIIRYIIVESTNSYKGITSIIMIFEIFFSVMMMMGIVVIVENAVKNDSIKMSSGVVLKKAFSRWGSAIRTYILAVIIVFWPMFLLVIPGFVIGQYFLKANILMVLLAAPAFIWGVYYGIYYIFAINIVTLHPVRGKAALKYSKLLVKDHWWKIFAMMTFMTLINLGLDFGIGYSSIFLPTVAGIIKNILKEIYIGFSFAFITVALTVFFLNLEYVSDFKIEE